ncbi:hypothetical protein ACF0H5_005597 [Mactra antiquata]
MRKGSARDRERWRAGGRDFDGFGVREKKRGIEQNRCRDRGQEGKRAKREIDILRYRDEEGQQRRDRGDTEMKIGHEIWKENMVRRGRRGVDGE